VIESLLFAEGRIWIEERFEEEAITRVERRPRSRNTLG